MAFASAKVYRTVRYTFAAVYKRLHCGDKENLGI